MFRRQPCYRSESILGDQTTSTLEWYRIKSAHFCRALDVGHHICAVCHYSTPCIDNDGQLIVFDKQSKKNLETRLSFQIRRSSSSYGHSRGSMRSLSTQPCDRGLQNHAGNANVALSSSPYGNSRGSVRSLSTPSSNRGPQQHAGDAIDALSSSSYRLSGGSARSPSTKSSVHSPQQHAGNAVVATEAMTKLNGVVQLVQSGTQAISVQAGQTLFGDTVNAFEPLLSRIDTFVKIGSVFASVWACLTRLGAD